MFQGEEVHLVGDFTGNWKESVRLAHKGGSRYEADMRLRHGKYVSLLKFLKSFFPAINVNAYDTSVGFLPCQQ